MCFWIFGDEVLRKLRAIEGGFWTGTLNQPQKNRFALFAFIK